MKWTVTICFVLVVAGCTRVPDRKDDGGPAGEGGTSCPSFAGSWQIVSHCQSEFVGMSVAVDQSGCSHTSGAPFAGFGGTVSADGSITQNGSFEGTEITCTGRISGNAAALTCNENCEVSLTRGRGGA